MLGKVKHNCCKQPKPSGLKKKLNPVFQNVKQLFALVCETQKYSPVLQEIIENTKLLKDTKLRHNLAKVSFCYRLYIC